MSVRIALALFFAMLVSAASAQEQTGEDEDRFVIPPDAMSPLRRDEATTRVSKPVPANEVPTVLRDETTLPAAVRETRAQIMAAAKSGDIRKLKSLIEAGDQPTQLTFDELDTDPIDFLLAASGDAEGHEMLAILLEVLEAGFVRVEDEDGVLYVWPYFAAYPIEKLDAKMKVELFRLLTGGDYDEMREFGAYVFYHIGIGEDGQWRFFLSGDG